MTQQHTLSILILTKMIILISYSLNFCTLYKNYFYWGPGPGLNRTWPNPGLLRFRFRARCVVDWTWGPGSGPEKKPQTWPGPDHGQSTWMALHSSRAVTVPSGSKTCRWRTIEVLYCHLFLRTVTGLVIIDVVGNPKEVRITRVKVLQSRITHNDAGFRNWLLWILWLILFFFVFTVLFRQIIDLGGCHIPACT